MADVEDRLREFGLSATRGRYANEADVALMVAVRHRAGHLADLVAAVREEDTLTGERLACGTYSRPQIDCGRCWGCRVRAALAALDEASARG